MKLTFRGNHVRPWPGLLADRGGVSTGGVLRGVPGGSPVGPGQTWQVMNHSYQ